MSGVRVLTEPLGGARLVSAALAGSAPDGWFVTAPRSADDWRARLDEIRKDPVTARWTETLKAALDASGAARARLDRVANGAGVVVTTGQQPGLFGGPLYGLTKALSAIALADELEKLTGIPVAPVFWAATDDADVAEASTTTVGATGGARLIRVNSSAPPGTPLAAVPLDDLSSALVELERVAGSGSHLEFLSAVREAYRPGVTMGDAYVTLMRRLLEPRGISVLDASHPAVRETADPLLRAALRRASDADGALKQRNADLEAAGFTPQVALVSGLSTVFAIEDGVKRRLPIKEAKRAVESARRGSLSPNVLLRPVVERAILPTAAYVAGPGELAYFAQLSALAEVLEAAQPLAVPRWSGTIIEPHVERILGRYGLALGDLRDPHAAETRFARQSLAPEVGEGLEGLRADVRKHIGALKSARPGGERPLLPDAVLDGAERTLEHRVARLERRFLASQKRESASALQEIATARGSLFPNGKRQERALNPVPLLARHGDALIDAVLGKAREHAVRVLAGEGSGHETLNEMSSGRPAGR